MDYFKTHYENSYFQDSLCDSFSDEFLVCSLNAELLEILDSEGNISSEKSNCGTLILNKAAGLSSIVCLDILNMN